MTMDMLEFRSANGCPRLDSVFAVLLLLKLTGELDWAWGWVLLPFLLSWALSSTVSWARNRRGARQ